MQSSFQMTHLHLTLLSLLSLSALLCLVAGQQNAVPSTSGLFPPLNFATNFASRTEVNATSTCSQFGSCTGGSCPAQSCNDTCPFGRDLPHVFSLLESGVLSAGVQKVSCDGRIMYYWLYCMTPLQTDDRGPAINGEGEPFIYVFDGGNESFVTVTDDLSFLPSMGFTITGWVRQDPGSEGWVT